MGIVFKQSLRNSIFNYLGVALGAFNLIILVPNIFTSQSAEWGMTQLLLAYANILLPVSALGIPNVILRYHPWFFKDSKSKSEFISFCVTIIGIGLLVVSTGFLIISEYLLAPNADNDLYANYDHLLIPLLIGMVIFEVFSSLSKSLLKSTFPVFLKDAFLRAWNTGVLLLYYFELISFDVFITAYIAVYLLIFIILFVKLFISGDLTLRFNFRFFKNDRLREILGYSMFVIFGSGTASLIGRLDIVFLDQMLGLSDVAIYSIPLFMANLILVPARSISHIAVPLIAQAWKEDNLGQINDIYKKTSLNQLILGVFIFLGLWLNIENIQVILGEEFGNKDIVWILFFLGMAKLFNVATGVNSGIILTSKHFRFDLVSQVILVVLIVGFNFIFIPMYGIKGAAIAAAAYYFLYNLIKLVFIYIKFKMYPFSNRSLYTLVIGVIVWLLIDQIPFIHSLVLDIIVRSMLITIAFWVPAFGFRLSDDINKNIQGVIRKVLKR